MASRAYHKPGHQRQGVALLVTLTFLTLAAIIIVAFLSSMMTERRASKLYSDGINTRILADTALNVVVGQLRDGTSASGKAWISQPGLIRTFENGSQSQAFKLYSAADMVSGANFDPLNSGDIDPNWKSLPAIFTDLNEVNEIGSRQFYPIFDPRALDEVNGRPIVEGISITNPNFDPRINSDLETVPMPVRWLYVLQEGQLVSPVPGSGPEVARITGATPDNPIVGRIAFWTDDESAKINLNTASEGVPWETPVANTAADRNLAAFQPVNNEFQRYTGHPATVNLSPVLGSAFDTNNDGTLDRDELDALYGQLPRTSPGGSSAGTRTSFNPLLIGSDRLLVSPEDFLFQTEQTNGLRERTSPTPGEEIEPSLLEIAPFFLTTSSRAPDLNLSGKPRLSIWPVPANPDHRSAHDNVSAFASTIGGKPYHFTRSDHSSSSVDFNPQNRRLYQYLQSLTSLPVPGFGAETFLSKYGNDRDQILTQIFDYVRSSTNTQSRVRSATTNQAHPFIADGRGLVVPIRIEETPSNPTRGFGRNRTISEVAILLYVTDYPITAGEAPGTVPVNPTKLTSPIASPPPWTQVRAVVLFEFHNPNQGLVFATASTGLDAVISGFSIDGKPLVFSSSPSMTFSTNDVTVFDKRFGGLESAFWPVSKRTLANYPFISEPILLENPSGSLSPVATFQGGEVSITLRHGSEEMQTIDVKFPETAATIPWPRPIGNNFNRRAYRPDLFEERVKNGSNNTFAQFFINGGNSDVIRSMELATGDPRLTAALPHVPASAFREHENYFDSSVNLAHGLTPHTGSTRGRWTPELNLTNTQGNIDLPSRFHATGAQTLGGFRPDWDTGMAREADGAYVNKPDEGSAMEQSGANVGRIVYFDHQSGGTVSNPTFFSPNRQVASPVVFGSLPTGVKASEAAFAAGTPELARPWQTLLFHPGPANHPGMANPPDHLLLDLFHMPVIEPYPISEPFSTAGRINLNYQIVPFSYIRRDTGMRAVLESTELTAIPQSDAATYKGTTVVANNYRYKLNPDATLAAFETRFTGNKPFISASEICLMPLIPAPATGNPVQGTFTADSIQNFWNQNLLTGSNLRERPYNAIYPRVTTKSNSYTVHVRVQGIKKVPGTPANEFVANRDVIQGEYRGSFLLERYIDPNNPALAAFDETTLGASLESYYNFRVLGSRQFSP